MYILYIVVHIFRLINEMKLNCNHLRKRPGRHLLHFNEKTLTPSVHIVLLLDLPHYSSHHQQQQEAPKYIYRQISNHTHSQ